MITTRTVRLRVDTDALHEQHEVLTAFRNSCTLAEDRRAFSGVLRLLRSIEKQVSADPPTRP